MIRRKIDGEKNFVWWENQNGYREVRKEEYGGDMVVRGDFIHGLEYRFQLFSVEENSGLEC